MWALIAIQVLPRLPPEYQTLVVVGPYWVENLKSLPVLQNSPYLQFTGSLSEEELQQLYDTRRVFVAPLLESTGIATKIINAMYDTWLIVRQLYDPTADADVRLLDVRACVRVCRAKGVPVVTTALGLNGIGLTTETSQGVLEVHDDPDGFVDAINRLATDDEWWETLSTAAVTHVASQLNEAQQVKVLKGVLKPMPKAPVLGNHAKVRFKEDPSPSALSASPASFWINPGISALPNDAPGNNDLAMAVRIHNGRPLEHGEEGAFRWESEIWAGIVAGGTSSLLCDCAEPVSVRRLDIFPGLVSCDYSQLPHQDESDGPEDPRAFVFNGKLYLFVVSRPMVPADKVQACGQSIIQQYVRCGRCGGAVISVLTVAHAPGRVGISLDLWT